MRMLDSYRKRRAIKAFSKGLGPALSERFGRTPFYTADQIGDVVGSGKFRRYRDYLPYAFCLFMSQKDFEALVPTVIDRDQDEIRLLMEMLVRAYDPCISCSVHYLDVEFV